MLRDLCVLLAHLYSEDLVGFWNALYMHLMALPVDCAAVLVLCFWNIFAINSGETKHCLTSAEDCGPFVNIMRFNIVLGFVYVVVSIGAKLLGFSLFLFYFGGYQMIRDDEEAQRQLVERYSRPLDVVSFATIVEQLEDDAVAEECIICLVKYCATDDVTQLSCHLGHFFHSACLKMALSLKKECPICRSRVI